MSLDECIAKHTNRQYNAWQRYLEEQWNTPTLTDHYLMQIAQSVAQVLSKQPGKIKIEHFKLKFVKPKRANPKEVRQKQGDATRAALLGALGFKKPKSTPKIRYGQRNRN